MNVLAGASIRAAAAVRPRLSDALFAAAESSGEPRDPASAGEADAADVRGSLSGDGEAYGRLVRRWQGEVGRWVRRFARGAAEREELVHDVFVAAYFSLRSWRGRAPFGHWLRRIAVRAGCRLWRQRERAGSRSGELSAELAAGLRAAAGGTEPPAPALAAGLLDGLLGALSPRDRLVLTLLHVEGRSVAEAADLAGWSRAMVKVQAHRARRRLRRLLERAGAGEGT